jgi:hypothetical protein
MTPNGFPQVSAYLPGLVRHDVPTSALHSVTAAELGPMVPSEAFEGKNHPKSLMAIVPVRSGQLDALRERLRGKVFTAHAPGVHDARFAVLADGNLLFTSVHDETRTSVLDFLQANASTVDEVWRLCEGYPEAGANDLVALDAFLREHDAPVRLMFSAYIDPGEPVVREAVALRRAFLRLVQAIAQDPGRILACYDAFLAANHRRIDAAAERHEDDLAAHGTMVPGNLTTAFTMVSRVRPGFWPMAKLRFTLGFGNFVVNTFRINPISEMRTVHFARLAMYDTDKLIFASIYDGDWRQYVQDFAVRIPFQMDKVWGHCVGWPAKGAADTDALVAYLEACRVPTNVVYSAYMDVTTKDILASYALGRALWSFTKEPPADAESFRARFIAFIGANQRLLP